MHLKIRGCGQLEITYGGPDPGYNLGMADISTCSFFSVESLNTEIITFNLCYLWVLEK